MPFSFCNSFPRSVHPGLASLTALILLIVAPLGISQAKDEMSDTPASSVQQEPQYIGQFFALGPDGTLVPLEKQQLAQQHKTRNRFIYVQASGEYVAPSSSSPVRLGANSSFVVRMQGIGDNIDPSTLIALKPFTVEKDQRSIPISSAKTGFFQPTKGQTATEVTIPLTFKKYGTSSLLITPAQPLPPGEYGLFTSHLMQVAACFGVDPGATGVRPGPAALNQTHPSLPARPAWKTHPATRPDDGTEHYEAVLAGTSESRAGKGAALLTVSCTVQHFTAPAPPSASIQATVRVRRSMIDFATDGLSCTGDSDGDYNQFAHMRLGSGAEETGEICFEGELPADKNATVDFGTDPVQSTLDALAASSGDPFEVHFRVTKPDQDDLVARFPHGENGAALTEVMSPCLQVAAEEKKAEQALVVASCPAVKGKSLSNADVLAGAAMKKLPVDGENTIGKAWNLPKATKTRVRPRLTLACDYSVYPASATAKPEHRLVPVPTNAVSCVYRSGEDKRLYASCHKAALAQ